MTSKITYLAVNVIYHKIINHTAQTFVIYICSMNFIGTKKLEYFYTTYILQQTFKRVFPIRNTQLHDLRFLASETFSAARFSAANNCWIPWVWLAISDDPKNYVERESRPTHKSISYRDVMVEVIWLTYFVMLSLLELSLTWALTRAWIFCVEWNVFQHKKIKMPVKS